MNSTRIRRPYYRGLLLSPVLILLFALCVQAQGNFVYVNNNTINNTVTALSVGPDGTLTEIAGSPFQTGGSSFGASLFAVNSITAIVARNFLFAVNDGSGTIAAFSINPATGALTAVPGSPFPSGTGGTSLGISLAATPDGRLLIASNGNGTGIAVFSIASNGALTPIPGSPFPTFFLQPDGIKITPDGRFLAVASPVNERVAVFNIANDGTLSEIAGSSFFATGEVAGLEINCAGDLLFGGFGTFDAPTVAVFTIASSGALTPVPGSPFVGRSGNNSNSVLLSRDERFLFVSNTFSDSVSVFSVAPGGALSEIPGSPFPAGGSLATLQMDTNRAGNLLYVGLEEIPGGTNGVAVFTIASNGALTPVPGSPFPAGPSFGVTSMVAFPSKDCALFEFCLQDESSPTRRLQLDRSTGDYLFVDCAGLTIGGKGKLTVQGGVITLEHTASTGRVTARIDAASRRGTASIQVLSLGRTFTITDMNITNNTCSCP
jgi:6-phosphogluconolactonase